MLSQGACNKAPAPCMDYKKSMPDHDQGWCHFRPHTACKVCSVPPVNGKAVSSEMGCFPALLDWQGISSCRVRAMSAAFAYSALPPGHIHTCSVHMAMHSSPADTQLPIP